MDKTKKGNKKQKLEDQKNAKKTLYRPSISHTMTAEKIRCTK